MSNRLGRSRVFAVAVALIAFSSACSSDNGNDEEVSEADLDDLVSTLEAGTEAAYSASSTVGEVSERRTACENAADIVAERREEAADFAGDELAELGDSMLGSLLRLVDQCAVSGDQVGLRGQINQWAQDIEDEAAQLNDRIEELKEAAP